MSGSVSSRAPATMDKLSRGRLGLAERQDQDKTSPSRPSSDVYLLTPGQLSQEGLEGAFGGSEEPAGTPCVCLWSLVTSRPLWGTSHGSLTAVPISPYPLISVQLAFSNTFILASTSGVWRKCVSHFLPLPPYFLSLSLSCLTSRNSLS